MRRHGLTMVELLVMVSILVVLAIVSLPMLNRIKLSREHHWSPGAICQNNLKQMGLVYKMYANESKGELFPGLRRCGGTSCADNVDAAQLWAPDGPSIYPEYLTDVNVLVCPSDEEAQVPLMAGAWTQDGTQDGLPAPCKFGPLSYSYLPWVFSPDAYLADPVTVDSSKPIEGLLRADFAERMGWAVEQMTGACASGDFNVFDQDIELEGTPIHRIRGGVERLFVTDPEDRAAEARVQSEIPIMYEAFDLDSVRNGAPVFHHERNSANVLFLDGHVELIRYPDKFPICETWSKAFAMLNETR